MRESQYVIDVIHLTNGPCSHTLVKKTVEEPMGKKRHHLRGGHSPILYLCILFLNLVVYTFSSLNFNLNYFFQMYQGHLKSNHVLSVQGIVIMFSKVSVTPPSLMSSTDLLSV